MKRVRKTEEKHSKTRVQAKANQFRSKIEQKRVFELGPGGSGWRLQTKSGRLPLSCGQPSGVADLSDQISDLGIEPKLEEPPKYCPQMLMEAYSGDSYSIKAVSESTLGVR